VPPKSYFGRSVRTPGRHHVNSCESKSGSKSDYRAKMTEAQFAEAKNNVAAYQQSACGSSGSLQSTSANVQTLQKFIEPKVYDAYKNCLDTFKAGIRWSYDYTIDQRSVSIDLRYAPADGVTQPARMFGVSYSDAFVSCRLKSPESTNTDGTYMQQLVNNMLHSYSFAMREPNASVQIFRPHLYNNDVQGGCDVRHNVLVRIDDGCDTKYISMAALASGCSRKPFQNNPCCSSLLD
jgi:hypothetical protein